MQDPKTEYDLLIIGGGANGAGVVIDAASRGLKCAVVDKFDFASGTSSRSTKLAHGGIRYFEQMVFLQGDPIQSYDLLKEALHERSYFMQAAPYLNREMQLLIPTHWFASSAFWYYPACFLYHMMYMASLGNGDYSVRLSGPKMYLKNKIIANFPEVSQIHGKYGVVMHEAQMIDSRMNLNTLFTSTIDNFIPGMKGSNLANYTEFVDFMKNENGKITGAKLKDGITGKEFSVSAKCVVNCAGVHSDTLRLMDNDKVEKRIQGARGTHLMFKKGLLPKDTGILIPKTKDGRVLFICNYLGHPMVGTTDEKCDVTHYCEPTQQEIDFMFKELEPYFGEDYDFKNNMISAWAGIRPLVKEFKLSEKDIERQQKEWEAKSLGAKVKHYMGDGLKSFAKVVHFSNKKSSSTAKLSRSHVIEVSDSGLVSLLGGKWTSFRHMG